MKREILFRGFHPDENGPQEITLNGQKIKGRWVEGDFCHPCNIIFEEIGYDPALGQKDVPIYNDYAVIPETVGQYIEIEDRDGQKIFEEDVVKTKTGRLGVVYWFSSQSFRGWDLEPIKTLENILRTPAPPLYDLYLKENLEVVGNIFSDPELIEG